MKETEFDQEDLPEKEESIYNLMLPHSSQPTHSGDPFLVHIFHL